MRKTQSIKTLFAAFAIVTLTQGFVSDTAFTELHKLNMKYREMKEFSMNLSYKMYANHTTGTVAQESISHYVKRGNTIYLAIEGMKTLQTEKYLIAVIDKEKKILVTRPSKDLVEKTSLDEIEKTLKLTSNLKMVDNGNERVFKVNFKPGTAQYENITIYETKKANLLEKMIFYMSVALKMKPEDPNCKEEKPRMEVFYEDFKTTADVPDAIMNENYYIKKAGNALEPSGMYKSYKLINNYLKN